MKEQVLKILNGAIDMHVHTAPSHFPRKFDDLEIARDMDIWGMGGCVIKSHYMPTGARAAMVNMHSGCRAKLYGGVTLDQTVGGLNPYAVESEMLMGSKMVWMPTFHAQNHIRFQQNIERAKMSSTPGIGSQPVIAPPVRIVDQEGKLVPEVYQVFDVIKKYNGILGTGHLSCEESLLLCREGTKQGVRMMATHPDSAREKISLAYQQEMVDMGVMLEKCWLNIYNHAITAEEMVLRIRTLGAEHCVLTTDFGQKNLPTPAQGLADFIACLLEKGVSDDDLRLMCRENPLRILEF